MYVIYRMICLSELLIPSFIRRQVRNGHIKRITDNDIHSQVLEVEGTNVRWVCTSLTFHCTVSSSCHSGWRHLLLPSTVRPTSRAQLTRRKHWALSFRSLWWSSRTSRSILHLKSRCRFKSRMFYMICWCFHWGDQRVWFTPITSRCWMIKMSGGDFEQVTIRARRAWSPSYALCQWGWMTDGTRFSSTCQTSLGGRMEPTTSRRCEYRSVPLQVQKKKKKSFISKFWPPFFCFQIHANCRIRRVYFSDRLYSEDELPAEFKLYLPVQNQKAKV